MSDSLELNEDFRDLIETFQANGVRFVIVGAHALAAHGHPRATGDLDVLVKPAADNADLVLLSLEQFGAPVRAHGLVANDFSTEGNVYQMGLPPRRIDILTSITGVSWDEIWEGRLEAVVAGLKVPFIGRTELIANKQATGRPKDKLDVTVLERR